MFLLLGICSISKKSHENMVLFLCEWGLFKLWI